MTDGMTDCTGWYELVKLAHSAYSDLTSASKWHTYCGARAMFAYIHSYEVDDVKNELEAMWELGEL